MKYAWESIPADMLRNAAKQGMEWLVFQYALKLRYRTPFYSVTSSHRGAALAAGVVRMPQHHELNAGHVEQQTAPCVQCHEPGVLRLG